MQIIWNDAKRKGSISDNSFEDIVSNQYVSLSKEDKEFVLSAYNNEKYGFVVEYVYNKSIKLIQDAVFSLGEDMVVSLTHWLDRRFVSNFFDIFVLRLATELGLLTRKEELIILEITESLQKRFLAEKNNNFITFDKEITKYYVVQLCGAVLLKDFSVFTESIKETIDKLSSVEILPFQDSYNDILCSSYKKKNMLVRMMVAMIANSDSDSEKTVAICKNAINLFPFIWDCSTINDKKFFAYSIKQSPQDSPIRGIFYALANHIKMIDFNTDISTVSLLLKSCQEVISYHFSIKNSTEEIAAINRLESVRTYPNLFLRSVITPCLVVMLDGICGSDKGSCEVAMRILSSLTAEKWHYYFKNFFESDDFVFMNIATRDKAVKNWCSIVRSLNLSFDDYPEGNVKDILFASKKGDTALVKLLAIKMFFD